MPEDEADPSDEPGSDTSPASSDSAEAVADAVDVAPDIDRDDLDPELDELFTEEDVADVDPETVWDRLGDADASDDAVEALFEGGADAVADTAGTGEPSEAVVAKQSYCHRCRFFSSPPTVACSNPGTEIVELVDVDHFRVRNCPVVERRRGSTEVLDEES